MYYRSHGLNNARNKLSSSAEFEENHRKLYQPVLQYNGIPLNDSNVFFYEPMKLPSDICFLVNKEQVVNISELGIKRTIYDETFPKCIDKCWPYGSSDKFGKYFVANEKKVDIVILLLDSAAVDDTGIPLF